MGGFSGGSMLSQETGSTEMPHQLQVEEHENEDENVPVLG